MKSISILKYTSTYLQQVDKLDCLLNQSSKIRSFAQSGWAKRMDDFHLVRMGLFSWKRQINERSEATNRVYSVDKLSFVLYFINVFHSKHNFHTAQCTKLAKCKIHQNSALMLICYHKIIKFSHHRHHFDFPRRRVSTASKQQRLWGRGCGSVERSDRFRYQRSIRGSDPVIGKIM